MTSFNIANALKHLPNNQTALAHMAFQAINAAIPASFGRDNSMIEASWDLLEGKVPVGEIRVKVYLPDMEAADLVRSDLLMNKVVFTPDVKRPKRAAIGRVAGDDVLRVEIRWNRQLRITVMSRAVIEVGRPNKKDVVASKLAPRQR